MPTYLSNHLSLLKENPEGMSDYKVKWKQTNSPADLLETVRRVVTPRVVLPGTASTSILGIRIDLRIGPSKNYWKELKFFLLPYLALTLVCR